jgi:hypothetical protein
LGGWSREGVSANEDVAQSAARALCIYGFGRLGRSRQCRYLSSPQGASPPPQEVSFPSLPVLYVSKKTRLHVPGLFSPDSENAWKTGRAMRATPADADRID